MYREKNADQSESWKNSYKLLNIENESAVIDISSESTKFRATSVKSYYECWDRKQRERDIKLVIGRGKDDRVAYWLASIKSSNCSSYILEEVKKNSI
jgi:hypothetical protein